MLSFAVHAGAGLSSKSFSMLRPNAATLDSLRSTRTRVAKSAVSSRSQGARPVLPFRRTPSATAEVSETDIAPRDFSNFLGQSHPLRIIFVGHNPSAHSWARCAPYAHPTNKFWRLLNEADLAPAHLSKPECFASLPHAVGIGFIDLFVTSGSDASKVGRGAEKMTEWRADFMERLGKGTQGNPPQVLCCVSKMVASKLLGGWNGTYGAIGTGNKWGLHAASTSEIWVLPSTSGRAGLKWEQRLEPFQQLRRELTGEWKT